MYEQYYGFNAKPFQLRPDPTFFFGSKGHKRAAAYLEYGLSQGEGFIVITGDVGAGKTTLVRNLFRNLESENIVAAQIANTHLDADDTLRMVANAFGIATHDENKATLLNKIEQFLLECDAHGKRALLVVDEAQNLSPRTVEELRMLSNFHANEKPLLQTFLLGQPEFRRVLLGGDLEQLQQRVIATYHLGPMDDVETRAYIEHRLHTVGWRNDPEFRDEVYAAIYKFTGGIPRKINTLCDRLLLMGYLEEIHVFGQSEVDEVVNDIQQEFVLPADLAPVPSNQSLQRNTFSSGLEDMENRMTRMESSVIAVLDLLKQVLALPKISEEYLNKKK